MCAAVDMLASQHYFYGHSPPAGFLSEYGLPSPPPVRRTPPILRGRSAPCLPPQLKTVQLHLGVTPRSILRAPEDRAKKRVVFADDRGYALEQVRFMTEPSHVPPYWTLKVVPTVEAEIVVPEVPKEPERPSDRWECRFAQPASDYVGFRRRITDENVSLENVIIKESEGAVDGTVKVKNLDFGKEVLVRATADGWRTHEDTHCAFSEGGPAGNAAVSLYDTFAFRLQLPIHSRRLEFCVCFTCKGEEFWDSNGGQNYVVERRSVRAVASPSSFCGRVNSGNSWRARSDTAGKTPYW